MTLATAVALNVLEWDSQLLYDVKCPKHDIIVMNVPGYSAQIAEHDHNLQYHHRALNRSLARMEYW